FELFRLLLSGNGPAYATEIAAAVFGGLLTIVVTAIMLQKQSDVDMRKDRNAAMLGARLGLYGGLIEELGAILAADDITQHIVAVQVLNQRLALLASKDVVQSFSVFAAKFAEAAKDGKLNDKEKDGLLEALGEMSIHMRVDILSGDELHEFAKVRDEFRGIVTRNVNSLKTKAITQQGFIEACSGDERPYFEQLVGFLEEEGLRFEMGTKGMSVRSGEGKPVLWAFPSDAKRSIELLRENLPEGAASEILAILTANGIGQDRLDKKRVGFRPAEIRIEELKRLLLLTKSVDVAATWRPIGREM
ncbi:MAG: hypothetical protein WCP21_22045, partial [Armatimonadota bacterium]